MPSGDYYSNYYNDTTNSTPYFSITPNTSTNWGSTIFPCGHMVHYAGIPPQMCPTCGQAHQWAADASAPLDPTLMKVVKTAKEKLAELSPKQWLDNEIKSVCDLAWSI
ncbi:MAG: hypothetical protein KGL39_25050 [Patescibacteria group bacterium]|nr:hypothetical protein [Patescibacteria group bacterium]